jgi:adenine-specific DNA-methyltransferase
MQLTAQPLLPYMGTKRSRVSVVASLANDLGKFDRLIDLFAGSGSVALHFAARGHPVAANDTSHFIVGLQRAQLLPLLESAEFPLTKLRCNLAALLHTRVQSTRGRVASEAKAVQSGPSGLCHYMQSCPSVSTSDSIRLKYMDKPFPYDMVLDYFGSTYFSALQAIAFDALREAIDATFPAEVHVESTDTGAELCTFRDIALAAYVLTVSRTANTTGHGAQYLKPSETAYTRVCHRWSQPVIPLFALQLDALLRLRMSAAKSGNSVTCLDARDLLRRQCLSGNLVYADPPYTKDQYSRMYHLHETMFLYDAPSVSGAGIARVGRVRSDFSLKSRALDAVREIIALALSRGAAVMLNYPVNGLVSLSLNDWCATLHALGHVRRVVDLKVAYSGFGRRAGGAQSLSGERIFVITGR